ncbi:ras family-domain-containing protein [Paraphysoderma sedebokerense]|nr:ras family-domain-containing protein [Paraphysoderma sedebokerense]
MPQPAATEDKFELVVVGSGGVGKSCLTVRFLKDEFTSDYDPTVEENYRKNVVVDQLPCQMSLVDTAGQHEYSALRDQHLSSGNGFLLVFALNDNNTFEELKQLRERIIQARDRKRLPFVVVGNKCDLPDRNVDQATVQTWCASLKIPYFETSAKANINVTEAFQELVRQCRKDVGKAAASGTPGKVPEKAAGGGGGCCIVM